MILKIVERPLSNSITMFSKAGELKQNIIENNSIRFIVRHETKTHLSVSVQSGPVSFRLNEESDYSTEQELKFVTKKEWNYFSGRETVNHYYKLSKKQSIDKLLNHIKSLTTGMLFKDLHIEELIKNIDTFTVTVELPDDLLALSPMKIGDTEVWG